MASFVSSFILGAATGSVTTYAAMSADAAATVLSNAAIIATNVSSALGTSLVSIGNWMKPRVPPQEEHTE
jgi:hypothetical protein